MVPLARGSVTNCSLLVPLSFCGRFGLKPTFGRLSRHGSFPFVADLDHLGPMARSVTDLALSYDAMQGPDPADRWCAQKPVAPSLPSLDTGIAGLRSEEHTSELQSLMRISYAVFCLKKKPIKQTKTRQQT